MKSLIAIAALIVAGCTNQPIPERWDGWGKKRVINVAEVTECSFDAVYISNSNVRMLSSDFDVLCMDEQRSFHCEEDFQKYPHALHSMVCEEQTEEK